MRQNYLKIYIPFSFRVISINKDGSVDYTVKDISNIFKIKDHLCVLKYTFAKAREVVIFYFLSFMQAISIFEQNIHRTDERF